MAEHFSFFDAVLEEDGVTYDREYNAQQFTKYFGALVTTGVMKGMGNMLAVSANGSNMVTQINTGIAFIEGKYYENDNPLSLTHDTETLGNSRIDRIVIRMDLATEARYVRAFIKKGVPSTNPVPPTLTQTANLYEISLAQVRIVGGQTFIATNAITDERGTDIVCPWAGSNILPNFDDNALAAHISNEVLHVKASQEEWINAVLMGDWNNINSLQYYKDQFNIVHIYGFINKSTTSNGNSAVFLLPVGYRPQALTYITIFDNYNKTLTGGNIATNGYLSISEPVVGKNYNVNISFRAEL